MKLAHVTPTSDATFTVRIPSEIRQLLDVLSISINRSKNYLAREAITRYVQSESEIIEGIKEGMKDARVGRVVPHADVMKQMRKTIANARRMK
jgi:predicted transcriptional regulator